MTPNSPLTVNPQERLKHLINYSNAIEVDPHIPPIRYYRSGLEMVRMANVYNSEGSLENAYVLYLKFMTLFLEKIRKHPDFTTVPVKIKAINQAKLREILPKAEKLREELLKQYNEEYNRYNAALKHQDDILHDKDETPKAHDSGKNIIAASSSDLFLQVETPDSIENVSYPDPNLLPMLPRDEDAPITASNIKTPLIDRSKKPSDISPSMYGKSNLRNVVVPTKVMSEFLNMARRNTRDNVETCGILAGKLEQDELFITHMILPKQKGTSDSCTTMNEEEIFDFQDQHNLITIGWIHTHPTQTAFLSSVDLHTHCPYQLLMPEAIAIVCAPRYNETGFFVLTPNHGLKFIANCRKSGFHPHPTEPALFTVAGHVKIVQDASLDVIDLRLEKLC